MAMFLTTDGYTLFFHPQNLEGCRDDCDLRAIGNSEVANPLTRTTVPPGAIAAWASGIWTDTLDPELQDNFWYGDDQSPWDVDSAQRLDGRLLYSAEEINCVMDYLESLRDGKDDELGTQLSWAIGAIKAFRDDSAKLRGEMSNILKDFSARLHQLESINDHFDDHPHPFRSGPPHSNEDNN